MKHRISTLLAPGLGFLVFFLSSWLVHAQSPGLSRELYLNIPGNNVADLTSAASFPDHPTTRSVLTEFFETGPDEADNYGQRIRGFLNPPETGDYVFWIASDDQSLLYLSPDADPAHKRVVAGVNAWTSFRDWFSEPNQQSAPVRLEAGQFYYIEALMKEGTGGDHFSVRWQRPLGSIEEPVPIANFLPFGTALFPPLISRQPASITITEGEPASFRIEVTNGDSVTYQWQRNNVPIPGANTPTLTIARATLADDGARFRCTVVNALGFALSEEAVLTLAADRTPPGIANVYNSSLTEVVIRFSEFVSTNSALVAGNYSLDAGILVTAARPGSSGAEILLTTTQLVPETTYTLTVNGVTDRASVPNPIAANSTFRFTTLSLAPGTIGRTTEPAVVLSVPGGLDIQSVGAGFAGTNDQGHFSYQQRTGDFDVQVRIESLQLTTLFAQAGIAARENLAANSPFAATLATPGMAGTFFSWRGSTGAVAQARGAFPVNFPQTWLRLRRTGTNFTGFASYDGAVWSPLGAAQFAISNTVYLGLVLSSRTTNTAARASFRDFRDFSPVTPAAGVPADLEPLGPSSRRTSLVISEIMYRPPDRTDGQRLEYVELFNADSVMADLSGYQLSGDVDFTFPAGTSLPAGAFLVVAQSPSDFSTEYAGSVAMGPWNGQLPGDVGTVRLRNRVGAILLEVEYSDEAPWPAAADGAGHSLVLARPSYGEGDPRAWAASARVGGSPGRPEVIVPDPFQGVVINEVLAHTDAPTLDYLELYNHGAREVDLSDCILTDNPATPKFRIAPGTVLPPGGWIAWDESQLGFALAAEGEAVFLGNPDRTRIIDAVRFGPQLTGLSSGRAPDGAETWRLLAATTPGSANGSPWRGDIVISELMYHPPAGERGEYVELHNRGTNSVDLKDWRFAAGVDFTFTNDLVIQPGAYLAVAADADYLHSVHPEVDPGRIVGNFQGNLRNRGERVAVAVPELLITTNRAGDLVTNRVFVTVSEVTYRDGGRWGKWSDGGGSSLELIDPRTDPRLAANWGDSDETRKAAWAHVEFSGLLELGQGEASELHAMLLGAGECLIDNVQVLNHAGANLISNPTFEGGIGGWIAQGNHVASLLETNGFNSRSSLRIRASSGGDNGANRVKTALTGGGVVVNNFATLRADVKWLRGHPDLLLRLKGNYLETLAHLVVPENLGTPGAPNSRRTSNAGPAILDVRHFPVVPAALEALTVTARIEDPDGVGPVKLKFRYDPSVTVQQIDMRDDGVAPDLLPGDGLYTARLPGQAAGVLVAFWVDATDAATPPARATFPADPSAGECLVRFGDEIPAGSFGTYRLWLTQHNTDVWTEREFMSNEPLDGTIVYGTSRAVYNGGARYRGSPFIRPGYSGPTGSLCGYVWTLPSDDEILGSDEFNLDWLEQPGRDPTFQRERVSFWIGEQLGVPFTHVRYIRVYVNGVRRGEVYSDSQQPNGDYISSWFPNADNGQLFKIDDWFEFDDFVSREFNVDARLERYADSSGQVHKTRYRWNWEKKFNRGLDDDYSPILSLVEALNLPSGDLYTRRVQDLIDADGWLRTIATRRTVADWDGYGYGRGKNTFAYLPPDGHWRLLLWDLDFSLGGGSDGTSTPVFTAEDPVMTRLYQDPYFGRVYLQAFSDAVRGPLSGAAASTLADANYAAFLGNYVAAASPAPIKSWIAARRDFLSRLLATNTAPWSARANTGAGSATTDQSVVVVVGTAPIDVRSVSVNGFLYSPTWTTRTNWSLRIPLRAGTNQLLLAGVDRRGGTVGGASSTLSVVYTGQDEQPEDFVRITEIHYEPTEADAEFVEIHNRSARTTFDLSGWMLEGLDYEFSGGSALAPGAFLLVVKDRAVFERAFGPGLPIAGEYSGRLNNAGETLKLLRPGTSSRPFVTVNEVTYSNRAPWPAAAAGLGGSLQIIDADQDTRRPANWSAVDGQGHGHATWQFASVTDRATRSTLRISLGRPGEIHLDDVSLVAGVVPRTGPELVANGSFEEPLGTTWIADPAVAASRIDSTVRRSGRSSLQLIANPNGFTPAASLRQTLAIPATPGQFYTLSFWYLPDRSGSDLTVRLETGGIFTTVDALESAVAPASPGAPSSVRATITPFPDLWINEVAADGTSGTGSWIELFNGGLNSVSLAGWFLSADPIQPGAWPFPANTSIGPGEFLVIHAGDSAAPAGGLHASFSLASRDGSVVLARSQNGVPAVVDYLHYAGLAFGRSIGSYPDGAWSQRLVFEIPTPGGPNDLASLPVRLGINEWMSRNNSTIADPADGDYDDWFELYNDGSEPVDLSGYSLTDDPGDPRKSVIPGGFVLPPHGVMLVWADGETQQNRPGREFHADFSLNFAGETLALFSPGGAIVDRIDFGPQGRDISDGRRPDGPLGSIVRLEPPSPRAPNVFAETGDLRFTAIQFEPLQVILEWNTIPDNTYQVQFTPALGMPWTNLGPPIVATQAVSRIADPISSLDTERFYRVVRVAP